MGAEEIGDGDGDDRAVGEAGTGSLPPRLRIDGRPATVSLGEAGVDAALGGGFPASGLSEIHGEAVRDAGCLSGLAAGLASRLGATPGRPVLWITERPALHEAGFPYPLGFHAFAVPAGAMTLVCVRRLEDAIWAAEEAARCAALSLVVLEALGNSRQLGLEGTRRLHVRAEKTGLPLVLMRQSAEPQATAAPFRLRIRPGPARPVGDLADQPRLIGAPLFRLAVEKNRFAPPCLIDLAWSFHDRSFRNARSVGAEPLPGAHDAQAADRPDHPRPAGAQLAFRRTG
ncbi:hypothetical protein [Fulvimarina endophytica]|nr:hypothetical protein [Fulvimarina endophytica]